ncbi:MAG: AAA family ATPase [Kiritimatiellae bacterium]|nr:AAA family ATPase [Kiritimatiellia bacterium]
MPEPSLANAEIICAGGPYTIRSAGEIMGLEPVVEETVWGGIPIHSHGATAAFFGPPGSHKSRLLLHLAVHQILGRPFAGMPVHPKPLRWLILNGENSLARIQRDLSGFAATCTAAEKELLAEHLFLSTLETDADGDLMLDEHDAESGNARRIYEAVARVNPNVLVVDTLPAAVPDELDAKAIRYGLGTIRKAAAASAIIYIGHARPGVKEEAKAFGSEALSYQRGNRVLNGILRCVWNVRRCEIVDDAPVDAAAVPAIREGVELIHAKSNNGKLLPPTTIELDEATFLYRHVPNFNHQAWQETLEKMAKANQTSSPAQRAAEAAEMLTSTQGRVQNLLTAQGPMGKAALVNKLIELGVSSSKRNAAETIRWLCENGQLVMNQLKPNRPARYYTPEQFKATLG